MQKTTVCFVASSKTISYSGLCIRSLVRNALDPMRIVILTDFEADRAVFADLFATPELKDVEHRILIKSECDALAEDLFAAYPHVRRFREGHPCWLKITDPLLVAERPEEDIVVLDPDLFFPNPFRFEPSPETGILLMRQGPNCLYPPEAVEAFFAAGIRMADHTDIGAAQFRRDAFDIGVLEDILSRVSCEPYKAFMHIESLVWAALAMRLGGCHFNPQAWFCWERGYLKRIAAAIGVPGPWLLRLEPVARAKCAHLSGRSKWWVVEAFKRGVLQYGDRRLEAPTPGVAYLEFTPADFQRNQRRKKIIYSLGYGKLFRN